MQLEAVERIKEQKAASTEGTWRRRTEHKTWGGEDTDSDKWLRYEKRNSHTNMMTAIAGIRRRLEAGQALRAFDLYVGYIGL